MKYIVERFMTKSSPFAPVTEEIEADGFDLEPSGVVFWNEKSQHNGPAAAVKRRSIAAFSEFTTVRIKREEKEMNTGVA